MKKRIIKTNISSEFLRQFGQIQKLHRRKELDAFCCIDKMAVHPHWVDKHFLKRECDLQGKFKPFGYKKGYQYRSKSGLVFQFMKGCIYPAARTDYKIQFNPKYEDSIERYFAFLEEIMCGLRRDNHEMGRLDIAYFIHSEQLTPDVLDKIALFKWKRKLTKHSNVRSDFQDGDMTGLYSNGSGVRSSSYSEDAKLQSKGYCDKPDYTKCEIQIGKADLNKKGIHSIYDLHLLPTTNLINRVSFYDPIYIDKSKEKYKKKFEELQLWILSSGLTNAKRKLNKNRNFDRDHVNKYLREFRIKNGRVKLSDELKKIFNNWFMSWLGEQLTEQNVPPKIIGKSWMTIGQVKYYDEGDLDL